MTTLLKPPKSVPIWILRSALVVAVLAISCAAIFFRKASPTHPLTSAAVRLSIAFVLLSPWVVRGVLQKTLTPRIALCAVGAGVMYALHFGTWVTSLVMTTVAASVTLVTATPLVLALASLWTKKDPTPKRIWIALGVSLVGLGLIGSSDSSQTSALLGDALALGGAVAMAGYLWIARRLGEDLDVWAFSGVATGVGAFGLWVGGWWFGAPAEVADGTLLWLILAALVPQLIGHTLLTWALRWMSPAQVGMATLGEPVFSTALAWWILNERVSWSVALGCAVTVCAVLIALGVQTSSNSVEKRQEGVG